MSDTKDAKSTATGAHVCECSRYEVESWIGEVPEGADPAEYVRYSGTGCDATTGRTFAMGHDARLKSLLIRAGAAGNAVRRNDGGVVVTGDAMQMAAGVSPAIAARVEHGIRLAAEKAARQAEKDQAAAAEQQPQPKLARIKLGRRVYDAVLAEDGSAMYTATGGEMKVIPADKVVIADEV